LISYTLTNADLRVESLGKKKEERAQDSEAEDATIGETAEVTQLTYPANISLGNFAYFLVAPTLCYQPNYPRTPHFRPVFFLKRVFEFLVFITFSKLNQIATFALFFLIEQYAKPTLKNSLEIEIMNADKLNVVKLLKLSERILKLSVVFHTYILN
jgi:diacylglycerol O-acyltransferase-1